MKYRCWALALLLGSTIPVGADDPPPRADKAKAEQIQVPYRRTMTQHILVRAKINGKGPFNFIIDSGAPLVFVNTAVGKKLGLDVDPDTNAATLDRLEVEGGVVLNKVRVRVETPFQLEGMNGMGLAGAELHGILGYTLMAKFKIEVDFTKDKMGWTLLDFKPPPPQGIGAKAAAAAGGLEMMGTIMKFVGFLYGTKTTPDMAPRGFIGIELAEKGADDSKMVEIKAVLAKSPAAEAGLKVGDRIVEINSKTVSSLADVQRITAESTAGQTLQLQIRRGTEKLDIRVAAGEGL